MAVRQLPILRGIGQAASRKVKSSRGESIAEVLVAMLISVVALTILAGMITSTGNILKRSQAQMNLYNEAAETLVQRTSPSGTGGTVTMTEGAETWRLTGTTPEDVSVSYYVNAQFASTPVVAYAAS